MTQKLPAALLRGASISTSLINLGTPVDRQRRPSSTRRRSSKRASVTPDLATIQAGLDRADVRQQFAALGVDASRGRGTARDADGCGVATLADRMEQMPAGGDLLAVIGIVFVILLVLELVGVIDIFKKT